MFVRLKILWFTKKLFLIFQSFQNLPLKSILIFSYVPISEVALKLSHTFQEIIIKKFQKFIFNVSKTSVTFLQFIRNFFLNCNVVWNMVSILSILFAAVSIRINTKFFRYFNITTMYVPFRVTSTLPRAKI